MPPALAGGVHHEITVKDIEQFKLERSKTAAPATVNRELATLKTMLAKAVAWGKLKENSAKTIHFLREPKGRVRFLEQEEIVKLLSNCNNRTLLILQSFFKPLRFNFQDFSSVRVL